MEREGRAGGGEGVRITILVILLVAAGWGGERESGEGGPRGGRGGKNYNTSNTSSSCLLGWRGERRRGGEGVRIIIRILLVAPKLGWRKRAEREGRAGGRGGKN